uniref:Opioid growth factor receptor (OGFr) conserved domain-containing protein n=1 Tax=Zooxanthella nutricula TaxID=1333877 RepID=A0A7S2JQI4_9DINO
MARFCWFLGLELRRSELGRARVVIASHFRERVPDCWSSMFGSNHNWLRISRVLHCLGLCGLRDEQQALLQCLEELYQSGRARCASAMPHWRGRARQARWPSMRSRVFR